MSYGRTNEFSFGIVGNPVLVCDLSATVLHLPGIQHEKRTCRCQGLNRRLTGVVPARVVHGVLV